MLALACCRREKLSKVMRSFPLADQPEIEILRELALVESAQSDRIDVLKLLLGSSLHFAPHAMAKAIRAAKKHECTHTLPVLLGRESSQSAASS